MSTSEGTNLGAALAAIDIGTNSVHMIVARPVPGGSPEILAREKFAVRLGSGGADMTELDPHAIDRALHALDQCRRIAQAHGADVVAIATSAVREADNRAHFIDRAARVAGVEVEVVSGVEEARLIHLGVLSAVPVADRRHVVVDIGGGSTEFVIGEGTSPVLLRSLKLGHIRLTDRFFPGGIVSDGAVRACRQYVTAFVAPLVHEIRSIGFEVAVGSSGTIECMQQMALARRGSDTSTDGPIGADEIAAVTAEVISRHTPKDRLGVAGLDHGRADVIVAGAVLLDRVVSILDIDRLEISTGALREGLLLDRFGRREAPGTGLHHLSDLRASSVQAMARRYDEDVHHAGHATDLALRLFDETHDRHRLGNADREVLEAAGLLHNVGRFIAHSAHHKHSAYVIRNTEHLAGFTDTEIELIAQVARYHRRSAPKPSHQDFAALREADRARVEVLAGLLRIGIALDRTYRRVVTDVRLVPISGVIRIGVEVADHDTDVELELFTARERCELLGRALGEPIEFEVIRR